jgi:HAMP domain-containing protein
VAALTAILHKSRIHEESDLSIVRYDDNTVFADTIADTDTFANVTETGLLSMENLEKLRDTVDYSGNLSHAELMEALEKNVVLGSTAMYTVHPLPIQPKNYDPSYEPKFLVIHAISNNVFAKSEHIKNEIEDDVQWISLESFAIAAIGLALIFVVLWFVSRALTQPLLWMERVAWGIVNHADERSINSMTLADYGEPIATGRCVPSTEISELVREFGSMIKGFSGDGSATVAHGVLYEIRNQFTWQSDYQQIYSLSSSATDKKSVRWPPSADEDEDVLGESTVGEKDVVAVESNQEPHAAVVVPIVPAPPKQNLGVNILRVSKDIEFEKGLRDQFAGRKLRPYRSSLFWWILLLIVVPLVLTNAVICWIVSFQILEKVSLWIHDTADESLELELAALHSVAVLKSTQAQLTINEVVRDLHVMTRLAGWLFFDGIARSDAFTHMEEKAAQECRGYVADDSTRICPFFNDFERAPCACEWEDLNAVACTDVNYTDARTLQERFFVCQAQDYDKVTGNRDDASSFGPGVQDSPNTTLWWDDVDKVPGAEKGRSASGFETTYDRIRVSSAISVVEIPIYNYVTRSNYSKYALSTYIAFQADGMVTGYHGCDHKQAFVSTFESNESNRAFKIAPKLCPKGKFGFDPRCREWYSTGHSLYNKSGQPVFITAPYLLATPTTQKNQFAATATSPIVNPATGLYVGQTLLDFCPGSLRQLFESLSESIAFLITPDDDEFGGDTVIGPGDFDRWESVPIGDRLFKFERPASVNQAAFETGPLKRLKNGESGIVKFARTTEDGSMELLRLAFEPVSVTVLLALDPSDLSRGVNATSVLVYSVGVAYREDEIQQPWKKTKDNIYSDLDRLRLIYLTVIVTVSALFIMCACNVSASPPSGFALRLG